MSGNTRLGYSAIAGGSGGGGVTPEQLSTGLAGKVANNDPRLTAPGLLVSEQAGATALAKLQNAVTAAATLGAWTIINTALQISGTVNVPSGARIDCSQGSVTQQANLTATFKLTNATNVRFLNPRFIGVGTDYINTSAVYAASGIWMAGTTSDVLISGGTITNMAGLGVRADNGVNNWRVRGVAITGPGAPPVIPVDSNFGGCIGCFDGCEEWQITDCELSQHGQGIVTGEVNKFRITNNRIRDIVGQHAMYLEPGAEFVVNNNLISGTTLQGIKLQIPFSSSPDAATGTIVGNVIEGAGSHGILLTQIPGGPLKLRRIVVADNVITGNGAGDGIQGNNLDNVHLHNNIIFNVRKGIQLTTSTRVRVRGNSIDSCTEQGILLTNVTDARVVDNTINEPASGNGGSTEFGIQLAGTTTNVLLDNNRVVDANSNMRYGLYVSGGDQTTLYARNNTFTGATDYGARLDSTQTLGEWSNNTCSGGLGGITGFPATLVVPGAPPQATGVAAPTAGTWGRGDIVWNRTPAAGGVLGWVCVTAGTPGTWSAFGRSSGAAWNGPGANNLLGAAFDPIQANVNMPVMTAGTLYLARVDLPNGGAVAAVDLLLGVAGATLTAGQNLVGVYAFAAGGALLGQATDQSSAWTSTGQKTAALTAPTAVQDAGSAVYVAVLWNGTTSPQLRGLAASAGFVNVKVAALPRFATAGSGLTALPSALPVLTAAVTTSWFGVS